MDIETKRHYKEGERWANVRRWSFGDGASRPASVKRLGSKVRASFVADLDLLGWRAACLLDEENTHR